MRIMLGAAVMATKGYLYHKNFFKPDKLSEKHKKLLLGGTVKIRCGR